VQLKNFALNSLLFLVTLLVSLIFGECVLNYFWPELLQEKAAYLKETEGFRNTPPPTNPFDSLHIAFPYIGTVNSRWSNNYGMSDPHPYPYVSKSQKRVIVGIFGGSVAEQEIDDLKNVFQKQSLVQDLLKRGYDIQILNFSVGAARQPQQLITAIQFLENIDIFVNLDGNNEVIHDPGLNFPVDFPFLTAETYFFNETKNQILKSIYWYYKAQYYAVKPIGYDNPVSKSTIYFLLARKIHTYYKEKYDELNRQLIESGPKLVDVPDALAREKSMVSLWVKYSRLQNEIVNLYHKQQLFFIQPIPHVPLGKILTDEEKELLKVQPPGDQQRRQRQYTYLLEAAENFRKNGAAVFDLTGIFRNVHETVYKDDCCHLNQLGREKLAAAMLPPILNAVKKQIK
jgi:hypothetical protein